MNKTQFLDKIDKRSDELIKSIQTLESTMKTTNTLAGLKKLSQELEIIRLELRFNTEVFTDLK